ncbi:ankyrin repeat-containing protein ITN1-like [Prosopis cineraria]|uniref:ankyrin repeat-containing protein ITN1-like n=1 Tax=Prosopis cineraria TaxID=364024 RepID=UPI0024100110|nr:ankyrin repeat-containing protein ITN1-like [Prosopis cineraria]
MTKNHNSQHKDLMLQNSQKLDRLLTRLCKRSGCDEEEEHEGGNESVLFIAAKNGVLEILEKILKDKPGAIHETNSLDQNVLHVTVENRQPRVFEHLEKYLKEKELWESHVARADKDDNTILHLAAKLSRYKPRHIAGSALQMQWEVKWFLFMKKKMPHMQFLQNKSRKTPQDIFVRDHEDLLEQGIGWLKSTSESCSVVAALIAGVAFATATTFPGGTQEETGKPYLERHPAFNLFAFTPLWALFCSITSLITFLSILTSRQQPQDFRKDLPSKLLVGLSYLFMSIASVLASFSSAFFFLLRDHLQQVVFSLYAVAILPIAYFGVAQSPLYMDLMRATFRNIPQSSNRESEKLIL